MAKIQIGCAQPPNSVVFSENVKPPKFSLKPKLEMWLYCVKTTTLTTHTSCLFGPENDNLSKQES